MPKTHSYTHRIDTIFVIALFAVFAVTAFLVVLIGAKQYKQTADKMNHNYEVRTATSYLQEKIRQNDENANFQVVPFFETQALSFSTIEEGQIYFTYIYYYDGYLRELYVSQDSIYEISSGHKIISLNNFVPEKLQSNLLKITVTDTKNNTFPLYLTLHSNGRKELP